MANLIFRGPQGVQPTTVSDKTVDGALMPGTFVEEVGATFAQVTTAVDKNFLLLSNVEFKDQLITAAYADGDTGVAYHVSKGMNFQAAMAAATYTANQPLTIGASGRLVAASSGNPVVAFFRGTPGAVTAGSLVDVVIHDGTAKA